MVMIKIVAGENEIYNEAGKQLIGSRARGQAGLSPGELLEASLALCISISLEKIMDYDRIDYDKSEMAVAVAAHKDEGGANRFSRFVVNLTLPSGLDEAYKEKLLRVVDRACTVGNTLTNGAMIETVLAHE